MQGIFIGCQPETILVGARLLMVLVCIPTALRLRGIIGLALYHLRSFFGLERGAAEAELPWAVQLLAVTSAMTGIMMVCGYSLFSFNLQYAPYQFLFYNAWYVSTPQRS